MIVVKVGGGEGIGFDALVADVAELSKKGQQLVLAHGGSHETNMISTALGKPPQFVTSISGYESRYTDRETLEIFAMVVAGKINKLLVEKLQRAGVNALGLCGADGRLMEGHRKDVLKIIEDGKRKVLRGDWSGALERVNTKLLNLLLENGYTPVVAPVGISYEGDMMNVDADRVAATLASAIKADTLILLSNVPGLLSKFPDLNSLIKELPRNRLEEGLQAAQGRMKKKILGAKEALEGGVGRVIIADARVESPITRALEGQGTVIQ
jgi:acetylglutamate/LysW-gamma-L-alpha-aminoadipate kinase